MSRKATLSDMECTHAVFVSVIILAQCFGMFPVSGVKKENHRRLHFTWKSFKVSFSLAVLCLLLINCGFQVYNICVTDARFVSFVTLLFFLGGLVTASLFFKLAMDWPKVIQQWSKVDHAMGSYGFPKNLRRKLRTYTATIMTAAVIEHSLFLTFSIVNSDKTLSGIEALHAFLENHFGHVFRYVRYNVVLGVLLKLVNIQMTFSWNYMDLFVILVSLSLAARFNQVTERMRQLAILKVKDQHMWMTVREDYDRLNKLCKVVDNSIGNITLLSFSNNLFVILVQLFNSLEPNDRGGVIGRVYFIYSFGFLILRTIAVSIVAARVDSESREPVDCLNSLPHHVYNVEIDRLLYQIKIDPSALTGKRFFNVSKSLILSITGAIVTYELILIQFNSH